MEKPSKKPIILTAILSMIFTVCLMFTLAIMSDDESTEPVQAVSDEIQIQIDDIDGLIENEIGEHFLLNMFLPSASEHFEYEDIKIWYSQKSYRTEIVLTVTDESYGIFMAELLSAEDKEEYEEEVIDSIINASEMLSSRLKGKTIIELSTPHMEDVVFLRFMDNELDFTIADFMNF